MHGKDWDRLDGMFRLRDEIFHKRLGWDISSHNGLKRKMFDKLKPVYLVARGDQRKVSNCARILPTMGPYMLEDVFPELLDGDNTPQDERTWELIRFTANADKTNPQRGVGAISLGLMREAVEFAEEHHVDRYVSVTSVAMEWMRKCLAVPMTRLANGKAR